MVAANHVGMLLPFSSNDKVRCVEKITIRLSAHSAITNQYRCHCKADCIMIFTHLFSHTHFSLDAIDLVNG
jgi:hypothetical protein